MKKFVFSQKMIPLAAAVVILLLALFAFRQKEVALDVDGSRQVVTTRLVTVANLLTSLDVPYSSADRIQPAADTLLSDGLLIEVTHAVQVEISDGAEIFEITSNSLTPQAWIEEAGLSIDPSDRIFVDGQEADPAAELAHALRYQLAIHRPVNITLKLDGQVQTFVSNAVSVAEALEMAGVIVHPEDRLMPPADSRISSDLTITLLSARQLTISVGGKSIQACASADTVGEALAKAGIPLQGLDYSQPAEGEPLPADGMIQVVRVSESITLESETILFESRFEAQADMDLDTRMIVQFGKNGMAVNRTRIRYEDGEPVSETNEGRQVLLEPVAQVEGYGTKITVQTMDTPDGTIEYYRAARFYATSFYPGFNQAPWYGHVSCGGTWKPTYVAVDRSLIPCGTRMYVPGYGFAVAMDNGNFGGAWIDLGYPDDAYVIWSQYVTVYFLTPIPATIPYIIPPGYVY